jgi:twitching motility protein PilU
MERDQAIKFVHELLRVMMSKKASDLFITAGFPPAFKVDGKMTPVSNQSLTPTHTMELARAIMNDKQAQEFEASKECNFAISPPGIGRFRVNAFVQQARVGLVLRTITTTIPRFEDLGLPDVLKDVAVTKRGSGDRSRRDGFGQIDLPCGNARLSQREQPRAHHHDRRSDRVRARPQELSGHAARGRGRYRIMGSRPQEHPAAGARRHPDREIRDRNTMDHAIAFAETGHLCLSTLHANSSNQALDRIINFFPEERRAQLLMDLSLNLKGMISQRLIPRRDGPGRVAAIEIMLNTPLISDLIFKGDVHELKEIMRKSRELGMQTFDQALFDLYEAGQISYEEAMRNADSMNELRLAIKLHGHEAKDRDMMSGIDHLNIV